MIQDSAILIIKENIVRATKSQISLLKGYEESHIVDAMGGCGALPATIRPLDNKNSFFIGSAITCYCNPADNLALIAAIERSKPGDVVIASTNNFNQTAVAGDLILGIAKNRKIAGFVTDGCVRDINGINKLGIPCFSSGIISNSPSRNGPGSVGQEIIIGNVNINSGDIVFGDINGVVVIPLDRLKIILKNLKVVKQKEEEMDLKIKSGIMKSNLLDDIFKKGMVKKE